MRTFASVCIWLHLFAISGVNNQRASVAATLRAWWRASLCRSLPNNQRMSSKCSSGIGDFGQSRKLCVYEFIRIYPRVYTVSGGTSTPFNRVPAQQLLPVNGGSRSVEDVLEDSDEGGPRTIELVRYR